MKRAYGWLLAAGCVSVLMAGCQEEKAIYDQARKDLDQGAYEEAVQGFQEAMERDVHKAESCRGAGIASLKLGDYEEAADYFEQALSQKRLDKGFRKDVLSYQATAQYKNGQYEDAQKTSESLLELSEDAQSCYLAGRVALAVDDYDLAKENFQKVIEEDSGYQQAVQIYEAYLERGMEADGTVYLEQALKTSPSDAKGRCEQGKIYYYMEDFDNAEKRLSEAVDGGNTEAMIFLGEVYLSKNDLESARASYEDYIQEEEDAAQGYNGLALCDLAEGDYESALNNIQNGIQQADTEEMQDLLFNEIVVYEKSLDFETAKEKAAEYLKMFPDDEAAQKESEFLNSRIS